MELHHLNRWALQYANCIIIYNNSHRQKGGFGRSAICCPPGLQCVYSAQIPRNPFFRPLLRCSVWAVYLQLSSLAACPWAMVLICSGNCSEPEVPVSFYCRAVLNWQLCNSSVGDYGRPTFLPLDETMWNEVYTLEFLRGISWSYLPWPLCEGDSFAQLPPFSVLTPSLFFLSNYLHMSPYLRVSFQGLWQVVKEALSEEGNFSWHLKDDKEPIMWKIVSKSNPCIYFLSVLFQTQKDTDHILGISSSDL